MSSINKVTFRIIGLFALITSAVFLSFNISELSKLTTVQSFIYQVTSLAINCIGIYGGFQLMKLRKVGHRLLTMWLLCQILMIVLTVLALASSLFFASETRFNIPSPIPTPLLIGYYSFSFIVLIYLLAGRTSKELLVDDNPRHLRVLATLLSLLAPGLARALVGNLLAGMALFYIYGLLITSTVSFDFYPEFLNSVERFLYYPVLWGTFCIIDWNAVKNFEKVERIKNDPAPDFAPRQVNGG